MRGTLLWKKDLGVLDAAYYEDPEAQWESGSSPIIHDGIVVVQADVLRGSFLAAFDAATGRSCGATAREDVPDVGHAHRPRRAVAGRRCLSTACSTPAPTTSRPARKSGALSGGGDIPVPTPVAADGLVFITQRARQRGPRSTQ